MTSEHEPHDPFARLRDADPAADRLAAPSIVPLLERLEERDTAATGDARSASPSGARPAGTTSDSGRPTSGPIGRRGARRPRRLGVALAVTVLVLAAALGAVGLIGRGPGGLDVVARARAALATNGEILHVATRTTRHVGRGGGNTETTVLRTERWSAEDPTRFRATHQVLTGPDGAGPVSEDDYAGQSFRSTSSDSRDLHVTVVPRRLAPIMAAQRLALASATNFGMIGLDPVGGLRRMLDDGRVHAVGEVTLDGRRLLRLVYRPRPGAAERGMYFRESLESGAVDASFPIEYLVDAETFAPARISYGGRSMDAGRRRPHAAWVFATTIVFDAYERLPATAENRRLLRIDASGLEVVRDPRSVPPVVRRVRPLRAPPGGAKRTLP